MTVETRNTPRESVDFIYPEVTKRDPFECKIEGKAQVAEISDRRSKSLPMLTAVIWGSGSPIAVLEDGAKRSFLVKTGETVNSYRVLEIFPTRIVLVKGRNKYELRLWKEENERLQLSSNLDIN